jgi:hypothetical protein
MNTSENSQTGDHEPDPEVAKAEAEAIESESSAGDGDPPTDLRAPTTPPVTPGKASTPAEAGFLENDERPEEQSRPAGVARDLEEKAEETGASTEPSPPREQPPAR